MKIDKDTKIFGSVSSNPGNTGSRLHNTCFQKINMNAIYIPFKCEKLKEVLSLLHNNKIFGLSVSMPFKKKIMRNIDRLDKTAKKAGNVNTIIKRDKKTTGYSTDILSLIRIIKKVSIKKEDEFVLLGNGAMGETIYNYLKKQFINKIILCSRSTYKFKNWNLRKKDQKFKWKNRNQIGGNILINSTPIGMNHTSKLMIFNEKKIKQFKFILDLPIADSNILMMQAKKYKIKYIGGKEFGFYQGLEQSKIYTKKRFDEKKLKKILNYEKFF